MSPISIPGKVKLAFPDADVSTYLAAVEAADGQTLETSVRLAYYKFITGCKADGIWDAIKASCILAGARTLAGALVPLKGTAPTNNNFVAADYNRKTGLVGDKSTKYLDSNRYENSDPLLNQHISTYVKEAGFGNGCYIGARDATTAGSQITNDLSNIYFISRKVIVATVSGQLSNFAGLQRNAAGVKFRVNGVTSSGTAGSPASITEPYYIFNRPSSPLFSDARISFYSIGESLDLALLDSRVSTLMTDIGAAIP